GMKPPERARISHAEHADLAGRLDRRDLRAPQAERVDLHPRVGKRRRAAITERQDRIVLEEAADQVAAEVAVANLVFDPLEGNQSQENLSASDADLAQLGEPAVQNAR